MRLILVEDDEIKRGHILEFLSGWYPSAEVMCAISYSSGLDAVLDTPADLVLLDMTLTTFDVSADEDGGTPRKFAGMELLGQMDRFDVRTPVIIVTQYDFFEERENTATLQQLNSRLASTFPETYRGTVFYNQASDEWKGELSSRIRAVLGQ
jgi:DNA-binding NarL/FixJ family response regulator